MSKGRYLLVEKPQGAQDKSRLRIAFRAPTYAELFQSLHDRRNSRSVRESGCYYQYVDRFEVVDPFEETGRIVHDRYWSYWEPGAYFADDDNTSLRFKAMELS